jgi:hypothetical protein
MRVRLACVRRELGRECVVVWSMEEKLRSFVQGAQTRAVECGSKRRRPEG